MDHAWEIECEPLVEVATKSLRLLGILQQPRVPMSSIFAPFTSKFCMMMPNVLKVYVVKLLLKVSQLIAPS